MTFFDKYAVSGTKKIFSIFLACSENPNFKNKMVDNVAEEDGLEMVFFEPNENDLQNDPTHPVNYVSIFKLLKLYLKLNYFKKLF